MAESDDEQKDFLPESESETESIGEDFDDDDDIDSLPLRPNLLQQNKINPNINGDEDENEEYDDEEQNYDNSSVTASSKNNSLNKYNNNESDSYIADFTKQINREDLLKYHQLNISLNQDEVSKMANITRNEFGFPIDPFHTTLPFLTKYEVARIIGLRCEQLDQNAKSYLDEIPESIKLNVFQIALEELKQNKLPFIVIRPLPNGANEYWKLQDLTYNE